MKILMLQEVLDILMRYPQKIVMYSNSKGVVIQVQDMSKIEYDDLDTIYNYSYFRYIGYITNNVYAIYDLVEVL